MKLFSKLKKGLPAEKTAKDPVCGMETTCKISVDHNGEIYSFCSDRCKEQFRKNPENYAAK